MNYQRSKQEIFAKYYGNDLNDEVTQFPSVKAAKEAFRELERAAPNTHLRDGDCIEVRGEKALPLP